MALSRRQFLHSVGGVTALGVLSACGGDSDAGSAKQNAQVDLPTYIPYTAAEPDLPATDAGVLPAYFRYPGDPKRTLDKPAKGLDQVRIVTQTFEPAPIPTDRNDYWQQLNDELGAELQLELVPNADYSAKFSTLTASGDLPDIMLIAADAPRKPELLSSLCADLTEFLAGDAIKDYPYLANIPTYAWKPMIYAGGIYGLPQPRPVVGSVMYTRQELLDEAGMPGQPTSYAEFAELCTALTDEKASRWAFDSGVGVLPFVAESTGAPNGWKEEGGKFTSSYETEEMKQAIGLVGELIQAGGMHPDGFAGTFEQTRQWFAAGRIALHLDGFLGWDMFLQDFGADVGGILAPLHDGGGVRHFAGVAVQGMSAITKADKDHVAQLLQVCNWLAAPFGTAEHLFRKWGTADEHFTWKDGRPERTSKGVEEIRLSLQYILDAPYVVGPNDEAYVRREYEFQKKAVPVVVENPTAPYFADTAITKGAELGDIITDTQLRIWKGDAPLSAWDDAVQDWRSSGGDELRAEFERAYQELGPA